MTIMVHRSECSWFLSLGKLEAEKFTEIIHTHSRSLTDQNPEC